MLFSVLRGVGVPATLIRAVPYHQLLLEDHQCSQRISTELLPEFCMLGISERLLHATVNLMSSTLTAEPPPTLGAEYRPDCGVESIPIVVSLHISCVNTCEGCLETVAYLHPGLPGPVLWLTLLVN